MTTIGNHIKTSVHKSLRDRVRRFYQEVLQCKIMPAPMPNLDLFVFDNDFVLGVFYCDEDEVLSPADHQKAAWLEIKTKDVEQVKRQLVDFGVEPIEYLDKTRFYFQAPGGQVFRLAPEGGGI